MAATPPFPLRDRIGAALTTACPRHSHCELMGPAVWAVVKGDLGECDTEIKRLTKELEAAEDLHARQLRDRDAEIAEAETQIQELGIHLSARDHALRFVSEHAEILKDERDQLKKLLEEALHLHMHGERAPGGNENWHGWWIKTERVLRAMLEQEPKANDA